MLVRKFGTYLQAWMFGRDSGYPFEVKRQGLWSFEVSVDLLR